MGYPDDFEEVRYVLQDPTVSCFPVENRLNEFAKIHQVNDPAMECPGTTGTEVLYFGDSFQLAMLPHLQKAFARTDPITLRFTPRVFAAYIEKYKPDLVIEQSVERQI